VNPPITVEVGGGDPVTVIPVQLPQAGLAVTAYWVMVAPLFAGAVQVRPIVPLV
jgi:hypothetical protein